MALTQMVPLAQLDQNGILELQNILLRAGYNPGPLDGVMGDQTRAAYSRFLAANGYDTRGNSTVVPLIDQLSKNVAGTWATITPGREAGAANTQVQPAAAVAPAASVGTPAAAAPATPAGPPPKADDGSTEASVRQKYPHLAYLLDNPEVKDVLLRATQGGWDQATLQGELWKTSWWQTTSNATRLWDQKFAQDNATAMMEWDQRSVVVANLAAQMGLTLTDGDAKWYAGRVLREGWSDEQLKRTFGQLVRQNGVGPGTVTEQAAALKALARRYLSPMQDSTALEYAARIAEGSLTRDGVESMIRNEAKNRFSWLAPQIDSGLTPSDLFSGTRNAVANTLEIDPNTIDFNNPQWSVLADPIMGPDGVPRSMTYTEALRWARKQGGWRLTDNANKEAANIELNVLQALGVMKGASWR